MATRQELERRARLRAQLGRGGDKTRRRLLRAGVAPPPGLDAAPPDVAERRAYLKARAVVRALDSGQMPDATRRRLGAAAGEVERATTPEARQKLRDFYLSEGRRKRQRIRSGARGYDVLGK